jgi:ankyrin repeat protein
LVSRLLEHVPTDAAAARGNLLHWAARRRTDDSVEVLRLILDRGQFDLNGIEGVHSPVWFEGFRLAGLGTPLHVAAKGGNVEMVKELLRRGSDASIRDTLGRTAVEVAEQEGHMSVVQAMRQLEPQKRSNLGARI